MENEFLLQILKFQFIAHSHTLTEHVKRNLKNSSFCLPVYHLSYSFKSSVASEMMSKPSPDETGAVLEWEGNSKCSRASRRLPPSAPKKSASPLLLPLTIAFSRVNHFQDDPPAPAAPRRPHPDPARLLLLAQKDQVRYSR